ncbi:MAG: copper-binding protein [Undibacterium sp.]|nr:copper-binding protein [Opitutaceae bacterium]
MKLRLLTRPFALLAFLALAATTTHAADNPAAPIAETAAKRHALRGVIVAIDAEKSAFRVRHEAIPGVMGAMTMQFKVDATALKTFKAGDPITALMSRQGTAWALEDIKPAK